MTLEELLRRLNLPSPLDSLKRTGRGAVDVAEGTFNAVTRGVPQQATGFVDLAALPFTMSGLLDEKNVVGGTKYLTERGLLPPETENIGGQSAEMALSMASPAGMVKGGLLGLGALGMAMGKGSKVANNYLVSTPKNPNPAVGTRYETEFTGGLLDKTPVNYEDYLGSSAMIMPWDSTSRNVKIKSVSDIDLPTKSITHGGGDYARDIVHQSQTTPVAGASGREIAERIKNRETQAIKENLEAGGTGKIIHLPSTMGEFAENFSVQPTDILLGIIDKAGASKSSLKELNNSIKNYVVLNKKADGTMEKTYPFKNFKGVETEAGRMQLYTGTGIDTSAGNLRKALTNRMYLKGNQETFGFNSEDLINSIVDPALKGVPKGYVGNTVIEGTPGGMVLSESKNPTYNTDFSGGYKGTLGQSVPVEILMPKTFDKISKEFANKRGDLRTNVLGAMEKRGGNISEIIDDQVLQNLLDYLKANPVR
jgi:hypothetical protein